MKFSYQKISIHQDANPSAPRISRPYVPIYLHGKNESTPSPYYALVDSGADQVLMPSELAELIGIKNIKKTERNPAQTVGVGGHITDVYFHDLEIQMQGDARKLPILVGFAKNIETPLLGRTFFKHFKAVIFEENKERIEFKI